MVHLELIKVEDCFKSPLMSIITTYRTKNYELFYSESWDFFYKPGILQTSETLNNRFGAIRFANEFKCLKKYYGIELKSIDLSQENMIDSINAETNAGRPVLVGFEPYWSPWNNNYKKNHGGSHCCFIIGVDNQSKELLCADPFYQTQFERWQIEEFLRGYHKAYIFLFDDNFMEEITPENIIENAIDLHKEIDIFNNIVQFGDEMGLYINFYQEIEQYMKENGSDTILWGAPYVKNLRSIRYGRQGFAKTLGYLGDKFCYLELKNISECLLEAEAIWGNIYSLLIKAALAYHEDHIIKGRALKKISDKIKEVADKEEIVHSQLLRCF